MDQALKGIFDEDIIADRKSRLDATRSSLELERSDILSQLNRQTLSDEQIDETLIIAAKIRKGISKADQDPKARRKVIELLNVRARLEFVDGKKKIHVRCIIDSATLSIESGTTNWLCFQK